MSQPVRVALISGPMYERLYATLPAFSEQTGIAVDIAFQAEHPALNAHLEGFEENPYDLISTHTKYAPAQKKLLAPLDQVLDNGSLNDFAKRPLELATIDGALHGLPRNVDVRLLHYRTDLIDEPPTTWDGLFELARSIPRTEGLYGFACPGKESGLFGTFYELAESAGATLFSESARPNIENEAGSWAMRTLQQAYQSGCMPSDVVGWHYDEVHQAFREGRIALAGDWPACYGLHKDEKLSQVADRFAVCPYPTGPGGYSRTYGGSHTFALSPRGCQNADAVALLEFLVAPEQQRLEAAQGSVPVRKSVMKWAQEGAVGMDAERWGALASVIETDVVIPPKLACYPRIEEVIWRTVQRGMLGQLSAPQALTQIADRIEQIRRDANE